MYCILYSMCRYEAGRTIAAMSLTHERFQLHRGVFKIGDSSALRTNSQHLHEFQSIGIAHGSPFDPIWPHMATYDIIWLRWTHVARLHNLVPYGNICPPIGTHMAAFRNIRPKLCRWHIRIPCCGISIIIHTCVPTY